MNLEDLIFKCKTDNEFNSLCLEMFDYQIRNNITYNKYSSIILKGKKPKNITEIPFIPIDFFKSNTVICKNKKADIIFESSGTGGDRSKHHVVDLNLYEKSFLKTFRNLYGEINDYCVLALLPSYQENKSSSLIYMIDKILEKNSHPESGYYLKDYSKLADTLNRLEELNQKTILFGVTYALLDFADNYKNKLQNTIVIETGGMKGKRKELLKQQVHEILKDSFSISKVHSEYGMTEILSQCYSKGDNIFYCPNWMKILIRDTNDPLTIMPKNSRGGINIIDLANIYSCPFIATQDLGVVHNDNSFSLLGRFSNAEIRGCNLLVQ